MGRGCYFFLLKCTSSDITTIGGKTEFTSTNKAYIKPKNFRAEGNLPECFMHTLSIMSRKDDILPPVVAYKVIEKLKLK